MGARRINPLEQHVEKIVVGVAGAGLLGIFAWQFVGGPTTVDLGKAGVVPIDNVYSRIEQDANKLKADVESESPKLPEAAAGGGLFAQFSGGYRTAVADPLRRSAWTGDAVRALAGGEAGGATSAQGPVHVPTVAAVSSLVAQPFMSIIDKGELTLAEGLAALLPKGEPFDKAAVSVEGRFNGVKFREQLELDPDGAGPIRAVPQNWWANRTAILAVELVREQWQADGTWGGSKSVPSLPGRLNMVSRVSATKAAADMEALLAEVTAAEEQVLRPEWYRRPEIGGQVIGEGWQPPSEMIAALDEAAANDPKRLVAQLQTLEKRLAALETRKARLSQPGAGGGRPGGGPGRGPGRGGQGEPPAEPANAGEAARLDREIAKLNDEIKALSERLSGMGVKIEPAQQSNPGHGGGPIGGGLPGGPRGPGQMAPGSPAQSGPGTTPTVNLLSNADVQLWAHDATVERGQTYRYKMRVWVSNPLFGRGSVGAEQIELTRQPYLVSADSAWTEPVTVDEETPFFITSANNVSGGGAAGRGAQAKAELFVFSWGYWRKTDVPLEPGDMIAGTVSLPDYEKMRQMAEAIKPTEPVQPAPGEEKGKAKPPEVIRPVRVPVTRNTVLLDVASLIDSAAAGAGAGGAARNAFQAYLRDRDGKIINRIPERERGGITYRRLNQSASAGLAAQIRPEDLKPVAPKPDEGESGLPPPRPPVGGGGGGGGGGG